ncbi:MAG: alpha/beta fold hydrolase [Ktedonobacterales bacterium]
MDTSPASSTELTLVRDGCTIHYWLTGAPDRPLVVFTHGAGIDHREWDGAIAAISAGFRVLMWDVRMHGASRPNAVPFTIRLATDDLVALLDHLGAAQAILVGHSLGGNITQEVIFRFPSRVRAAVLLGCANNTGKLTVLERLQIAMSGPLFALYPYDLLRRQSANVSSDRPEVRAYLYKTVGQMTKHEFVTVLRELLRSLHEEPEYRIPVPFLLTHGAHDKTGNIRRASQGWAQREPHCEYVVVPEAGHMANMDNPAFFNELLLRFLQQQAS